MERFIVFKLQQYYPCGGMKDVDASFADKEEAVAHAKSLVSKYASAHVFDCDTRKTVFEDWKMVRE